VLNFLSIGVATTVVAIGTEEGFFRGWLFASLQRAGLGPAPVVLWTSVAFALWHISAVSLPTGFDLPAARIPLFIVNAAVIGAIWGILRLMSGSVIVASVSHGLWNGLDYALFAFGTKTGALGIKNTAVFGPEVGVLGLLLNVAFALLLWRLCRSQLRRAAPTHQ
jgi:membrane protease YdiL (CAAX protease family)